MWVITCPKTDRNKIQVGLQGTFAQKCIQIPNNAKYSLNTCYVDTNVKIQITFHESLERVRQIGNLVYINNMSYNLLCWYSLYLVDLQMARLGVDG